MAKYTRYDDKIKDAGILMLEASGYPDTNGSLNRVADQLAVPRTTLKGWWELEKSGERKSNSLSITREAVAELLVSTAVEALEAARGRVNEASYSQLMIGAGISLDKYQLLSGKPTQNVRVLGAIDHRITAWGSVEAVQGADEDA